MPKSAHPMRNFVAGMLVFASISAPLHAQSAPPMIRTLDAPALTYADLVDLALPAHIVAKAEITAVSKINPALSADVAPGKVRLYIEARTTALLVGPDIADTLSFLADVPLDARGKVPKLRKMPVLLLADPVNGRPGELKLVSPDAMLPWTPELEARLRPILTELVNHGQPPVITGVRETMHVPGNLTGEGETQVFLSTPDGKPASLSILRRPGERTTWGVSFSEIVDQSAKPPQPETLAWYRLACALPPELPPRSVISGTADDRQIASEDYAQVIRELGPCTRNRPPH
ncbi:hypothetical protein C8K11_12236 [Novosphingobium sp. GV055]|nr:hypothetical protein C8K11_12236 [Novosphingobium sp. GV055]PUA94577.1 hypothetical protein C8K12_12236 [Novosphingobium sp. GV061]PUB13301.1 hypothetical protein C8K14_12236 [Novosphingobium sp. GV079]PUB38285.1 hypothetical protein C8K10_12236 [Novosphingobium sp. GV027]